MYRALIWNGEGPAPTLELVESRDDGFRLVGVDDADYLAIEPEFALAALASFPLDPGGRPGRVDIPERDEQRAVHADQVFVLGGQVFVRAVPGQREGSLFPRLASLEESVVHDEHRWAAGYPHAARLEATARFARIASGNLRTARQIGAKSGTPVQGSARLSSRGSWPILLEAALGVDLGHLRVRVTQDRLGGLQAPVLLADRGRARVASWRGDQTGTFARRHARWMQVR